MNFKSSAVSIIVLSSFFLTSCHTQPRTHRQLPVQIPGKLIVPNKKLHIPREIDQVAGSWVGDNGTVDIAKVSEGKYAVIWETEESLLFPLDPIILPIDPIEDLPVQTDRAVVRYSFDATSTNDGTGALKLIEKTEGKFVNPVYINVASDTAIKILKLSYSDTESNFSFDFAKVVE